MMRKRYFDASETCRRHCCRHHCRRRRCHRRCHRRRDNLKKHKL